MTARWIHWHEGMFLMPQHFQFTHRNVLQIVHQNSRWDVHFNWGLRSIEIDQDALANRRFLVRSLHGRMREGTVVRIPEDGVLAAIELRQSLEENRVVTVFVAIPLYGPGKANVAAEGEGRSARYLVNVQELEDENTGIDPQPVEVRSLNFRIVLSTEDLAGYELLPVARIETSSRADGSPQIDPTYFPPLLACDGWEPLRADILQVLGDRIGKKTHLLASQLATRQINFGSQVHGNSLVYHQLHELNGASVLLPLLATTPGIHPVTAYLELSLLVGRLAIFGESHQAPELPRYDHDDLAGCFFYVKKILDDLLDVVLEPGYKERAFVGKGLRMEVALESNWLEAGWQLYIGVYSTLESKDCVRLLTQAGQLDIKVGSGDRVDELFRLGHAGLVFEQVPVTPSPLPDSPSVVYFQVKQQADGRQWHEVQRSNTLAIRLNEKRIAGDIQGRRQITISDGFRLVQLEFTLYVVPQD